MRREAAAEGSLEQTRELTNRMRGFAAKTRASYLRSVSRLAKYCGKSPETLSEEELRRYFVQHPPTPEPKANGVGWLGWDLI